MHELGQTQTAARIVNKHLPTKPGPNILHLHADAPHLAPKLVIDEVGRCVLDDVPTASGVGGFRHGAEDGFEALLDFTRQLLALLTILLVGGLTGG